MVDFNANVASMEPSELLEYQQEVTRHRLAALAAGRRAQDEIDRRAEERAQQRAEEDAALGAVRKPPTQHLFGEDESEGDES